MKRGEIWTVSGGPDYAGKPRPMVVIQADQFSKTNSLTLCGLTSTKTDTPYARLAIEPTSLNGLKERSHLMVDKIASVPKSKIGRRIGRLDDNEILRMNRLLEVFLGLVEKQA